MPNRPSSARTRMKALRWAGLSSAAQRTWKASMNSIFTRLLLFGDRGCAAEVEGNSNLRRHTARSVESVEKRFCRSEISRIEPLREPVIDRLEGFNRLAGATLIAQ
jgi:hypothetical protein